MWKGIEPSGLWCVCEWWVFKKNVVHSLTKTSFMRRWNNFTKIFKTSSLILQSIKKHSLHFLTWISKSLEVIIRSLSATLSTSPHFSSCLVFCSLKTLFSVLAVWIVYVSHIRLAIQRNHSNPLVFPLLASIYHVAVNLSTSLTYTLFFSKNRDTLSSIVR